MGFSSTQILNYIDPEVLKTIENTVTNSEKDAINSFVDVRDGYARVKEEQIGIKVQQDELINSIVAQGSNLYLSVCFF